MGEHDKNSVVLRWSINQRNNKKWHNVSNNTRVYSSNWWSCFSVPHKICNSRSEKVWRGYHGAAYLFIHTCMYFLKQKVFFLLYYHISTVRCCSLWLNLQCLLCIVSSLAKLINFELVCMCIFLSSPGQCGDCGSPGQQGCVGPKGPPGCPGLSCKTKNKPENCSLNEQGLKI